MRRDHIPVTNRYMQLLSIAETLDGDEAIAAFLLAKRLIAKTGSTLSGLVLPIRTAPMTGDEQSWRRLLKILSLTDSDKEGESIAAFLMSINMMKRCDLSFRDILVPPAENDDADTQNLQQPLELELISLRNRVRYLHDKVAEQDLSIQRYRSAFDELIDASWALHHGPEAAGSKSPAPLLN